MELKELIEQYKECSDCMKTSNYPQEWLEDIKTRKKEVFANYTSKEERLPLIDAIHNEYSDKFDAEGLEVKIPYNGELYTLEEAEALLEAGETEEVEVEKETETSLTAEEFKAKRLAIIEAKEYLASTDFYFTVDKYATLSKERKLELNTLRAEARVLINNLES